MSKDAPSLSALGGGTVAAGRGKDNELMEQKLKKLREQKELSEQLHELLADDEGLIASSTLTCKNLEVPSSRRSSHPPSIVRRPPPNPRGAPPLPLNSFAARAVRRSPSRCRSAQASSIITSRPTRSNRYARTVRRDERGLVVTGVRDAARGGGRASLRRAISLLSPLRAQTRDTRRARGAHARSSAATSAAS